MVQLFVEVILEVFLVKIFGVAVKKFRTGRKGGGRHQKNDLKVPDVFGTRNDRETSPSHEDFYRETPTTMTSRKTQSNGVVVWKKTTPTTTTIKTEYLDGRTHVKKTTPTTTREWWE